MQKLSFIKITFGLLFAACFLGLSACFALPVEEAVLPPPTIQAFTPAAHDTAVVSRGNLIRYRSLSVHIVPLHEEILTFSVPDVYIHAIHVEVGDEVSAGEIVAELDREGFERAIYLARRDVEAAQIEIAHLGQVEPLAELEAAVRGDAADMEMYYEELGGMQVELQVRRLGADYLQAEDERRVLRAHMNGTVTHTMAFRPGDLSTTDTRVVTIADETQQIFSITGPDTRYLIPGDIHTVVVNREPIPAIVLNPDVRGEVEADRAFLTAYGEEALYFPERTFATMQLVLDELQDVLNIPAAAVHNVDGREFVFVIEDGLRVMRDVVTGMVGNHAVEIISGLTEGEIVVV